MNFLAKHLLCKVCFGVRHAEKDRRFKKECGLDGNKIFDHPLLHGARSAGERQGMTASCLAQSDGPSVALGVMKLYAYDVNHKPIAINVMLDEGSDMTLIREG